MIFTYVFLWIIVRTSDTNKTVTFDICRSTTLFCESQYIYGHGHLGGRLFALQQPAIIMICAES